MMLFKLPVVGMFPNGLPGVQYVKRRGGFLVLTGRVVWDAGGPGSSASCCCISFVTCVSSMVFSATSPAWSCHVVEFILSVSISSGGGVPF